MAFPVDMFASLDCWIMSLSFTVAGLGGTVLVWGGSVLSGAVVLGGSCLALPLNWVWLLFDVSGVVLVGTAGVVSGVVVGSGEVTGGSALKGAGGVRLNLSCCALALSAELQFFVQCPSALQCMQTGYCLNQ